MGMGYHVLRQAVAQKEHRAVRVGFCRKGVAVHLPGRQLQHAPTWANDADALAG